MTYWVMGWVVAKCIHGHVYTYDIKDGDIRKTYATYIYEHEDGNTRPTYGDNPEPNNGWYVAESCEDTL